MSGVQVHVYKHLKALQGICIPVFNAAGTIGERSVFLAVSGGERLRKMRGYEQPHLLEVDGENVLPAFNAAALDGLRLIHDAGVLHGSAHDGSLFVCRPQVMHCQWPKCHLCHM